MFQGPRHILKVFRLILPKQFWGTMLIVSPFILLFVMHNDETKLLEAPFLTGG